MSDYTCRICSDGLDEEEYVDHLRVHHPETFDGLLEQLAHEPQDPHSAQHEAQSHPWQSGDLRITWYWSGTQSDRLLMRAAMSADEYLHALARTNPWMYQRPFYLMWGWLCDVRELVE